MGTMRFSRSLQPLQLERPLAKRITVVAPQPDDEMLGAGGTLIHAIRAGASVHCIYLTSGKPATETELETEAVSKRIGYSTQFLRFPLNCIPVDRPAIDRVSEAIRQSRPQTLFLPFLLDDHDDHRRASHILLEAYKLGLLPDDVEIWAYQVYTVLPPNIVVDITDVADAKADALRLWTLQHRSPGSMQTRPLTLESISPKTW